MSLEDNFQLVWVETEVARLVGSNPLPPSIGQATTANPPARGRPPSPKHPPPGHQGAGGSPTGVGFFDWESSFHGATQKFKYIFYV